MVQNCLNCKIFLERETGQRFCSSDCRRAYDNRQTEEKHCKFCDTIFVTRNAKKIYCCNDCKESVGLQQRYGINRKELRDLKKQQFGRCAICGHVEPEKISRATSLHIDHDHNTKEIRGMLCSKCNRGLGLFDDDPIKLRKAADYLCQKNSKKV